MPLLDLAERGLKPSFLRSSTIPRIRSQHSSDETLVPPNFRTTQFEPLPATESSFEVRHSF
jgi:hypothetical protein